jgi:hypothetical protein
MKGETDLQIINRAVTLVVYARPLMTRMQYMCDLWTRM